MKSKTRRTVIHDIVHKPKQRLDVFVSLPAEDQPAILLRLSKDIQLSIVSKLSNEALLPILEHLDPDDATDILQLLKATRQKQLLEKMSKELQEKISLLLEFDSRTAAGIMSLNYIQVEENQKLSEIAERIRIHEKRTGKVPTILILRQGKLIGFLPIQKLIQARPSDVASDYVKRISVIKHTANTKSVINHLLDNPHQKIVVVNDTKAILGVIYSDDVLKIIQDRESQSLYNFAGISSEETIFGTTKQKVKFRYKWLIINLMTAFLAAFTIGLFDETISKYVLLAVYMPIVAGMGGNAATQTLAVLVRGIALEQIDLKTALPTLKKELAAALINGLINGVLVAGVVLLLNRDIMIALILSIAMIVNLLVAAFFGTLIPLIMTKLKKDPATSATIFITTATDVFGFLAFLGLATLLLK